jgi:hypothetical protein
MPALQSDKLRARRAWRVLRIVAAALAIVAGALILLIALGFFDPKPFGALIRTDRPGIYSTTNAELLPQSSPWPSDGPPGQFSVRLTAANAGGELDSGYGLALGDDARRLVVAVSPLGYVAIWEEAAGGGPIYFQPWQTWPHVRVEDQPNELWLDVATAGGKAEITAWINRELLWRGELALSSPEVGLWLGSFGTSTTVDFQQLEWFAPSTGNESTGQN